MLRQVNQHGNCDEFNSENVIQNFWKNFSILDCIGYVDEAWQEVSVSTFNVSWLKLLPEFDARKIQSQTSSHESTVQEVVDLARQVEGDGFQDLQVHEILEMVFPGSESISAQDADEMLQLATEEKTSEPQEEEINFEKQFHSKSLIKIINLLQSAIDEATTQDPVMTRSMHFKYLCEKVIQRCRKIN